MHKTPQRNEGIPWPCVLLWSATKSDREKESIQQGQVCKGGRERGIGGGVNSFISGYKSLKFKTSYLLCMQPVSIHAFEIIDCDLDLVATGIEAPQFLDSPYRCALCFYFISQLLLHYSN